ncbi:MAG: (2Fe-2S) ferredoxin domain-containing protein [Ghiorsea sp.]|nr:(2Fe-2S) ferredoxin domain-containing protein [Ghiorsea sp.]
MKIEVCLGENCKDYGGQALANALQAKGVRFTTFECRSLCTYAPVVFVNDKAKLKATLADVLGSDST